MQIYKIKPAFQKRLEPIAGWCVQNNFTPDMLNLMGIFAAIVMGFILRGVEQGNGLLFLIPIFALIRIAANALDGMVSRQTGIADKMGEVKNEFADRVADVLIFVPLGLSPIISSDLALITVALILLNSYLGIIGKAAGGRRIYSGWMGKADRMAYLSIASIGAYFHGAIWIHLLLELMIVFLLISLYIRYREVQSDLTAR